ncbi:hypothetical protein [Colwellia sp. MB02u-14]|uniref:hypothetical protein n=1 Tax=Colwellia sp. MB02u-14 TaxID=2759815 RepID=UPI0015F75928|nr:hypothetical protein [Colwellia sp. MB02u-14]MBA6302626.1 hypothetical protein [Colwellia sp. MB02u-14]
MKSEPFFYPGIKDDEVLDTNFCFNYDINVPYSAFDNLVIKNSKSDIKSTVKVSCKLTHLVFIIAVHIALGAAFNLSKSGSKIQVTPYAEPKVRATLYYRTPAKAKVPETKSIIKKTTNAKLIPNKITKNQLPKIQSISKEKLKSTSKETSTFIKESLPSINSTEPHSNTLKSSSLAEQSLNKLRASINAQTLEQGLNEDYEEKLASENSIDKSINKFFPDSTKAEEIKLKNKNVDCNSGFQRGVAELSGLLGGRVKCYSTPSLKDFLKSRNKH